MSFRSRAIMLGGEVRKVGTPQVTVLEYDSNSDVSRAKGSTLPTDGDRGYAIGCIFIKTGGSDANTAYVNVGTATSCDFNAMIAPNKVVNVTGSTLTVTAATHDGSVVTLNRAAGIAVTLPAASGSGARFRFVVGTTITSNTTTIKVANATDIFCGNVIQSQDGGNTVQMFEAAADSDTITFDGSTTGGIKGDYVEIIDIASGLFFIKLVLAGTGTEATPLSATVS